MDYYSKRIATCSSDRTVKIFSVDDPRQAIATLTGTFFIFRFFFSLDEENTQHVHTGHTGPVWQVSWSHPKFGVLLASCSYDKKVIIYKEDASTGQWGKIHEATHHTSSVNSVCWAPHQYGLCLACASSDGTVSVLTYLQAENRWAVSSIGVGSMSCNSVSWAPYGHMGSKGSARLVTGACDNLVKVWRLDVNERGEWAEKWVLDNDGTINGHDDWVRDVAWAPNSGMMCNTVASCSEDGNVFIHVQDATTQTWSSKTLNKFNYPVWRVNQVSSADASGFK